MSSSSAPTHAPIDSLRGQDLPLSRQAMAPSGETILDLLLTWIVVEKVGDWLSSVGRIRHGLGERIENLGFQEI